MPIGLRCGNECNTHKALQEKQAAKVRAGPGMARASLAPAMRLHFTDHAREAMARRGISEAEVRAVADSPEQTLPVRPGRVLVQSIREAVPGGQVYLVRVILDVWPDGADVVTVYRSSRIGKYWKGVQ